MLHRARYTWRRAWWQRRSDAIEARYRARAAHLPELAWDHPGLHRVAALRAARRPPDESRAIADDALAGRFRFLGRMEEFGPREVDWFRADLDAGTRLWKTLLHEFSYAEDLARAARAGGSGHRERFLSLARDWRERAPIGCAGFAADAWNARAATNRLIHWAVAGAHLGLETSDPDARWLGREIGLHGLFVRDNLELDLRGNHLFRDTVGLVFADTLAGGIPDALELLREQVATQVLDDGGHIERAPMYHALCLQDLVETHSLLGDATPDWLGDAVARMAGFLESIVLGDGEIPLLGDAWLGEVETPGLLTEARACLPPQAPADTGPSASGLVPRFAGPWRAVVRAGAHGPDYLLGHAHADLLSFDLSHGQRRVVTDTGTRLYDAGPARQALRATAAHNTIQLDDEELLEIWGSFRAGRRGRAYLGGRGSTAGWSWVSAYHDAYRWLPGRPTHQRLLVVGEPGALVVDRVQGSGIHRIRSRLHRHPDGRGIAIASLDDPVQTEPAPLQERFGEERPMERFVLDAEAPLPWTGGWRIGALAEAEIRTFEPEPDAIRIEIPAVGLSLVWEVDDAAGDVSFGAGSRETA